MKKSALALLSFALAGSAFAAGTVNTSTSPLATPDIKEVSPYTYELGMGTHRELYEEFDNSNGKLMQEEAQMIAIRGSVSRKIGDTGGTVILSGEYAFGDSNYTGAYWGGKYGDLKIKGLGRSAIETQLTYRHTSPMWNGVSAGVGLGYRRLVDNLQEAGPGGYKRVNDRYYLALSLEKEIAVDAWTITPSAQYKHILKSNQYSDLYGGINTAQKDGHGAEFAVAFATKGTDFTTVITPYYRLWDIKDSEIHPMGVYEPRNKTSEAGVAVSFKF